MKKTILFLFSLLVISSYANGQKGGILVYSDIGYSSNKNESGVVTKTTYLALAPGIGYGICENFILGLNMGYNSYKRKNDSETNKESSIAIGPFVRYVKPITEIFDFRTQATIRYLSGRSKQTTILTSGNESISKDVLSGFGINLAPSIGIHAGKHWCVDIAFGEINFQATTEHPDNGTPGDDVKIKNTDLMLRLNYFSFYWGVSYTFGCNKTDK